MNDSGDVTSMPQRSMLLTALILNNPMCLGCTAKHAGMTSEAVETAIKVTERELAIHQKWNVCGSCGVPSMVYFLERQALWTVRRSMAR
jgi:hypothetical protein